MNTHPKAKILIIDGEAPILSVLEKTLLAEGYEVRTATQGYDALKLAGQEKLDVILVELIMPDMDGFQVIHALREICPEVPLIAMCGGWKGKGASYLKTVARIGVIGTLAKPFPKTALMEALENALGKDFRQ